jgi:osmotically inducible lipoprotein OsmB
MRRIAFVIIILAFAFTTVGCANMSHTQQTTLSGGAIGAAGGAVAGAVIAGNPAAGAVVGGVVGAGVGYVVGEHDQGR